MKYALPLAVVALCANSLQASTIIFSDNFTGVTSGELNAKGWYFTGVSEGGTPWVTTTDNTSPLSGTVMSNPGATSRYTQAYKQFSTINLDQIGTSISIQLDFHTTTFATEFYSVGLLDSANTLTENVFGLANPLADADGYGTRQAFSDSPTAQTYHRIDNNAYTGTLLSTNSTTSKLNDNLGHSYTFSITRVATGVRLDSWIDGVALDSFTVTGGVYTSFNTLKLVAPAGNTVSFNVDNIVLSTVPEPSVFGLLTVVAGVGVFRRRRRNRLQS